QTRYPLNAFIFALESLTRAECLIAGETAAGPVWAVAPARTALEFCASVSEAAVERFRHQAGLAPSHWRLMLGKDLAAILSGLVQSGVLIIPEEGEAKLLQELSMMDGPLVVAA